MNRFLLPIFLMLGSLSPLSAREFTNLEGQTLTAEVQSLSGEGAEQSVTLKLRNGQVHTILVNTLSEADRTYLAEVAAADLAETEKGPSIFDDALDGKLVKLDGKRVSRFEMTEKPDYFAFYFSASWCGPCRAFTPSLVEFYDQNDAAGKAFELIFVSSDQNDDAMEEYMKEDEMGFPAIKHRYADMKEIRKYAGSGIPCLVVVDRDGKVIADSYVNGQYVGPTSVMNQLAKLVK